MTVKQKKEVSSLGELSAGIRNYILPSHIAAPDTTGADFSAPKDFSSINVGRENKPMYAIAFDLDTNILQQAYPVASYNNAYADIRARLVGNHGFAWQQGSVYFGGETVNAVSCVIAVNDLTATFSWFAASVRDIRMLRIEEQSDLRPAIEQTLTTMQALSQRPSS